MASEPRRVKAVDDPVTRTDTPTVTGVEVPIRRLWDGLKYSSGYMALIAFAKVCIVTLVLPIQFTLAPVVAGLVAFAIYANDRIVDVRTDGVTNPRLRAFVSRHERELYVLAALAYGLGVAMSLFGGPVAFLLAVTPGALWILYAVEWSPARLDLRRLKEVLMVNSVVVAAAWAVPIVVVPVSFAGGTLGPTAGILAAYFFLGTFVNVEIANVRDVEADERNGVATLPVALGVARTRRLLSVLTGVLFVVLAAGTVAGHLTATQALVLGIGPVALAGIVSQLDRHGTNDLWSLAAEFTRVPVFLVFAVLSVVGLY